MSMKDKLRELAEMVREAYRAGFIAACKWPEPVSQDVDSSAYNKEFNAWSFSVREKHAAILDAEGDGVAADVVSRKSALEAITHVERHNGPGRVNQARAMLESATQPRAVPDDLVRLAQAVAHLRNHHVRWDEFGDKACDYMIAAPQPGESHA